MIGKNMDSSIKFSIVVPCYNVEEYIYECVRSVIEQTYENWELILVDDKSSDSTYRIIEELASTDTRIKAYSKEHGGLPHTRNYGLNYVTGDYLILLDGDDYLAVDHLEKESRILENSSIDMLIHNQHTNFTKNGSKIIKLFDLPNENLSDEQKLELVFSIRNHLPAPAVMSTYRVGFMKEYDLYYDDKKTCSEDLDFFLHAISKKPVLDFAGHEFYFYRQDNQSAMTKNLTVGMMLDRLEIYKTWYDYYEHKNIGKFDCRIIQEKIAKEFVLQIGLYRKIRVGNKKEIRQFFHNYRYLLSMNKKITERYFETIYIKSQINRITKCIRNE